MQEEVTRQTTAFSVKAGKITAKTLLYLLKLAAKGTGKAYDNRRKQTVKDLIQRGDGVSNMDVTDKNLKLFQQLAHKHGLKFAVQKDAGKPGNTIVFFQAKNKDVMGNVLNAMTAKLMKKEACKKPSILNQLHELRTRQRSKAPERVKQKDRGIGL